MIIDAVTDDYELGFEGLEAFIDNDYGAAIELLTNTLQENPGVRPRLLLKRAESFLRLERPVEALSDVECVLKEFPDHLIALHLKARILLYCHQIQDARDILSLLVDREGVEDTDLQVVELIRLCDEKLNRITDQKRRAIENQQETARQKEEDDRVTKMADAPPAPELAKVPPKIRHEWYQTESSVIVSVLAKGLSKDQVAVDCTIHKLVVDLMYPDDKRTVEIDLFQPVKADSMVYKVTPSKVEITLMKTEGIRWEKLEALPATVEKRLSENRPAYPTSAKMQHNWDALEQEVKKEEADEKLEGDAALQKVFAEIYAGASDDAKRAMNKSYLESGGTVLSTNWSEIKEKKTDVKPPDGMEFKKW